MLDETEMAVNQMFWLNYFRVSVNGAVVAHCSKALI